MRLETDGKVPPVVSRILRLEELAHELSNSLGTSTGRISAAVVKEGSQISEDLLVATHLALQATATLQVLMQEVYALHRQVIGKDNSARGTRES